MTTDDYNVWSKRDLLITLSVCLFATFWMLRKKSARERFWLIAAGIVIVLVNFAVIFAFESGTWYEALSFVDAACSICMIAYFRFNNMAQGWSFWDDDD